MTPYEKSKTYYVYKHLDRNGKILYIGFTHDLNTRTQSHKSKGAWFRHVYKITKRKCKNKQAALEMENNLIKRHKPEYNIKSVKSRPKSISDGTSVTVCLTPKQKRFVHSLDYDIHGFFTEFVQDVFNEAMNAKMKDKSIKIRATSNR